MAQKTELLGGDGLMAPFSTTRDRKDDDDDVLRMQSEHCPVFQYAGENFRKLQPVLLAILIPCLHLTGRLNWKVSKT